MAAIIEKKMIFGFAVAILLFPFQAVGDDLNSPGDGWLDTDVGEFASSNNDTFELDSQGVDVPYFFDKMAPWGEWSWTQKHGWVWIPDNMPENWRPFTYGHWVYSEAGWVWASSFPWGWAAFHYGAWTMINNVGWAWVPSDTWAPARVIWRYSTAHVGWSPIMAGYDYQIGWNLYPVYFSYWSFVTWTHFHHIHIHNYYLPAMQVGDIFRKTFFPGHCGSSANIICHRGPSSKKVARLTGKKSKRRRLVNTVIPARRLKGMAQKAPKRSMNKAGFVRSPPPRSKRERSQIKPTPGATIKPISPPYIRQTKVIKGTNNVRLAQSSRKQISKQEVHQKQSDQRLRSSSFNAKTNRAQNTVRKKDSNRSSFSSPSFKRSSSFKKSSSFKRSPSSSKKTNSNSRTVKKRSVKRASNNNTSFKRSSSPRSPKKVHIKSSSKRSSKKDNRKDRRNKR